MKTNNWIKLAIIVAVVIALAVAVKLLPFWATTLCIIVAVVSGLASWWWSKTYYLNE